MSQTSARFRLSPSRLARYYFHECDRFLRYVATPKARRAEDGIPEVALDHNLVTQAILQTGEMWEDEILDRHLGDRALLAPGIGRRTQRRHTVEGTLAALKKATPGQALYQPTLRAPEGFYDHFGLKHDLVEFVDCYPDLLMVVEGDQGPEVRVVDAKASDLMKLSHRIQVTLYTILLEQVLADAGIPLASGSHGGVWLYGQPEAEWFELHQTRPPLEHFLRHELAPLLEAPAADAFWHVYFRCEWCDFYQHCRTQAEQTDSVSLVPYLSTFAKRHLAKEADVHTVADLDAFLATDVSDDVLSTSASLRGRRARLQQSIAALRSGQEIPTGAASVGLPAGEHIRMVITVQDDPVSGEVYGYAINRVMGKDLFGTGSETTGRVAADQEPTSFAQLRRQLVTDLMAVMRPVHEHNSDTDDWHAQKTLQAYVFDTYERDLLVKALLEATLDPQVAEDAIALFFHFQRPELVQADDQPAKEVFFPVAVLAHAVRSLFSLPVPISYRFSDVVAALQPAQYGFDYRHNDFFDFELSNRLKSNAIQYAWRDGRADLVEQVERQLRLRVWAANSVLSGIRERLKTTGSLFAWPPKFFLPPGLDFNHRMLSRLVFITRYEAVLSYLDTRLQRTAPEAERIAADDTFRLTYLGEDRYQLDPSQAEADIEPDGGFAPMILTTDADSARRARLAFDDFHYRDKPYPPKNHDLALASVKSVSEVGVLDLELRGGQSFTPPHQGQTCYLEPRFVDWNSGRLTEELGAIDTDPDPWFVRLVDDPVGTARAVKTPAPIRKQALKLARDHDMTVSQLGAFEGTLDREVQLVWGPPGTGKTHFLALALLCLAEAHRRAGLPLRVLVTGFTHAAIDNCLRKITELQGDRRIFGENPRLGKLSSTTAPDGVQPVHPKQALTFCQQGPIVLLGSTVWQARKVPPEDLTYDVVLIDEGSQLKVAEAAIAVRRLKPGGRLVVAGDHRQLPPIVQGDYPVPAGEPLLHRSILECLQSRPGAVEALQTPLLENFRMNDVLCGYPASSIYPADYHPFDESVASRRLPVGLDAIDDELLGLILDPAFPLVVCVLDGVQATAENTVEAELVADTTEVLRSQAPDLDDASYWKDRLFIVSPHHAQIRAIRRQLAKRRRWDAVPFVDTVDKMQGQECDAVIVSYGVADVEYALSEREFIYSLNRLNVSITRARAKTVVFISRQLLEPPVQALDRDDVAEGIAFMQGLAQWCREGESRRVARPGHSVEVLRR